MAVLDLEDQLAFYMAYHHQQVNVWIHTVCVPIILVTSFALATNSGPLFSLFDSYFDSYLNVGVLSAVGYASFYILLDPIVGGIVSPLVVGSSIIGTDLINEYGKAGNYIAGGLWVVSWILQFIGHAVYEKRAPALLDNLLQALVLAPFFVVFELVFRLGFRQDLEQRLKVRIDNELRKLGAEKEAKKATKAAKVVKKYQ
ncbi:uncharacterized protein V1513DRAFT_198810 [Lipomyces chichibuensis]|uniref:uncharacterized protein n=1 Tax=Lipomyces chichibuensis TaxID=1546026 RepID=UPI0033433F6C